MHPACHVCIPFSLLTLVFGHAGQMGIFYFGSSRVLRSIQYGVNPRNRLDLYVPRNHWRMESGPRAVVIYITGERHCLKSGLFIVVIFTR